MEEVRSYVLPICILCIVSCLCGYLLSGHSSGKPVVGIMNLIILISVVRPMISDDSFFYRMDDLMSYSEVQYQSVKNNIIIDILRSETEIQIRKDVSHIVEQYLENDYEVQVITDIHADNSINIKQITVVLHVDSIPDDLEKELKGYNEICTVVTAGETDNEEYTIFDTNKRVGSE